MTAYLKSLFVAALTGIVFSLGTVSGEENWTVLFNGKDLEGWTEKTKSGSFRVEGGVIIGTAKEGLGSTFLCSDQDYGDFELGRVLKPVRSMPG